jgi:hypothetical protein
MEHGSDADAGAKVLWIGGDGQHRLRCGFEQQIVEQRLVVEGKGADLGGQREHDMEVADRQQVGLALGEPGACGGALALGAVPVAATVIGDPPMAAVGAENPGTAFIICPSPHLPRGAVLRFARGSVSQFASQVGSGLRLHRTGSFAGQCGEADTTSIADSVIG